MIKDIIGAKKKQKTLALLLITNLLVVNPTGQCTVCVKYSVTIFIGNNN